MTRAFELMLAEVHRYEGTVNQFLGDGIMALFGAPIAHEDHAQRAVHAALGIRAALDGYRAELQEERGIEFQVRQGLNTGLVVVGSIGSDLRMDYTAVGDTTNVAARLLQAAAPGQVVISEAVQRGVGGYFETDALGPLSLKGKSEAVSAWRVVAARDARTRLDVEAERGLTSFVGRERELQSCRIASAAPRRDRARWSWSWASRVSASRDSSTNFSVRSATARDGSRDSASPSDAPWPSTLSSTCCGACSRSRSATRLRPSSARSSTASPLSARRSPGWRRTYGPCSPWTRGTRRWPPCARSSDTARRWTPSVACWPRRRRAGPRSWSSRTCTGSTPRPSRSWPPWWTACRASPCSWFSRIAPATRCRSATDPSSRASRWPA